MANYKQGKFIPTNKEKYVGKLNEIVYRSSWERSYMRHLDTSPNVLRWNSEEVIVPYYYPVDKKVHRYFPDMIVEYLQKDGSTKIFMVEIKPYKETLKPVQPKRKTAKAMARFKQEILTYEKNQAKWAAAREFCKAKGMTFVVLTEKELFRK